MQLHFPLFVDGRGEFATTDEDSHVRQLIEQLLFTSPGERVNRPDFGCGLLSAVFGTTGQEEMLALQFMVRTALERWLSHLIESRDVSIRFVDDKLHVVVEYVDRADGQLRQANFEVEAQ